MSLDTFDLAPAESMMGFLCVTWIDLERVGMTIDRDLAGFWQLVNTRYPSYIYTHTDTPSQGCPQGEK